MLAALKKLLLAVVFVFLWFGLFEPVEASNRDVAVTVENHPCPSGMVEILPLSEQLGQPVRTCVRNNLPYRLEIAVVTEYTGPGGRRPCPVGYEEVYVSELFGAQIGTCAKDTSWIRVAVVGEYTGPGGRRPCPTGMHEIYLDSKRTNFVATCSTDPVRVKLEAKGLTGDFKDRAITVQTGQLFSLRWSSFGANALGAHTSPSSGCPTAGSSFWLIFRWFNPPSGGTQALTAPGSAITCTYTATSGSLTDSVIVNVVAPTVVRPTLALSISPGTVSSGVPFTLISSSTNATSISTIRTPGVCPDAGNLDTGINKAKQLIAPSVTTTTTCGYTATATGAGGAVSQIAIVIITASAPTAPTPTLSGIVPSSGVVGAVVSVALTGTNFAAGATINAGTGIEVSNLVVGSATRITATFTIAATATLGNRNVTVTVGGLTSNPKIFTVNPLGGDEGGDGPGDGPGGGGPPFGTSCGLLVCFSYDPKVIILPPPGFTRIIKPFISEVAP